MSVVLVPLRAQDNTIHDFARLMHIPDAVKSVTANNTTVQISDKDVSRDFLNETSTRDIPDTLQLSWVLNQDLDGWQRQYDPENWADAVKALASSEVDVEQQQQLWNMTKRHRPSSLPDNIASLYAQIASTEPYPIDLQREIIDFVRDDQDLALNRVHFDRFTWDGVFGTVHSLSASLIPIVGYLFARHKNDADLNRRIQEVKSQFPALDSHDCGWTANVNGMFESPMDIVKFQIFVYGVCSKMTLDWQTTTLSVSAADFNALQAVQRPDPIRWARLVHPAVKKTDAPTVNNEDVASVEFAWYAEQLGLVRRSAEELQSAEFFKRLEQTPCSISLFMTKFPDMCKFVPDIDIVIVAINDYYEGVRNHIQLMDKWNGVSDSMLAALKAGSALAQQRAHSSDAFRIFDNVIAQFPSVEIDQINDLIRLVANTMPDTVTVGFKFRGWWMPYVIRGALNAIMHETQYDWFIDRMSKHILGRDYRASIQTAIWCIERGIGSMERCVKLARSALGYFYKTGDCHYSRQLFQNLLDAMRLHTNMTLQQTIAQIGLDIAYQSDSWVEPCRFECIPESLHAMFRPYPVYGCVNGNFVSSSENIDDLDKMKAALMCGVTLLTQKEHLAWRGAYMKELSEWTVIGPRVTKLTDDRLLYLMEKCDTLNLSIKFLAQMFKVKTLLPLEHPNAIIRYYANQFLAKIVVSACAENVPEACTSMINFQHINLDWFQKQPEWPHHVKKYINEHFENGPTSFAVADTFLQSLAPQYYHPLTDEPLNGEGVKQYFLDFFSQHMYEIPENAYVIHAAPNIDWLVNGDTPQLPFFTSLWFSLTLHMASCFTHANYKASTVRPEFEKTNAGIALLRVTRRLKVVDFMIPVGGFPLLPKHNNRNYRQTLDGAKFGRETYMSMLRHIARLLGADAMLTMNAQDGGMSDKLISMYGPKDETEYFNAKALKGNRVPELIFISKNGTSALKYETHVSTDQNFKARHFAPTVAENLGIPEHFVHRMSGQLVKAEPHERTRAPDFMFRKPSQRLIEESLMQYPMTILTIPNLDNIPDEVQVAMLAKNKRVFKHMLDRGIKPSESVQIALVEQDGMAIEKLFDAGIVPSDKVQQAAVEDEWEALEFLIDKGIRPSVDVQLAAVEQRGYAIRTLFYENHVPSEEVQLAAVQACGRAIEYIFENNIVPSEKVQLAAVQKDGEAITFIPNPSEKVQLAAVTQNGTTIGVIIRKGIVPSEDVQVAAVSAKVQLFNNQIRSLAIRNILNNNIVPSERVQMAAVNHDPVAIKRIIDKGIEPPERVQVLAVQKLADAMLYILDKGIVPSGRVQLAALQSNWGVYTQTQILQQLIDRKIPMPEYVQIAAVKKDLSAIRVTPAEGNVPSEHVQRVAMKAHDNAFEYMIDSGIVPSERVQLDAIKADDNAFQYMLDSNITLSPKVQLFLVEKDPSFIRFISPLTKEAELTAVQKDPGVLEYIHHPTEETQLAAIRQGVENLSNISDPTHKVLMTAVLQDYENALNYIPELQEFWLGIKAKTPESLGISKTDYHRLLNITRPARIEW